MTIQTIQDQIRQMEAELSKTKYNKATEHHFGIVKAQIAKLKEKIEKRQAGKGVTEGWFVKKSGDATVVLLGFPSVGKSTLLNKMTNANSKVAAYEFTTLDVIPGLMDYHGAKIQILDVPGIISGAAAGKGRGREVLAMVRASDLILILIDAQHPEHYPAMLKELRDAGVRVNQQPPVVKITRRPRGGLDIGSTIKLTKLGKQTIETVLKEFRINNAGVLIRTDIDIDQLIDAIEGNRVYIPAITVVTKADVVSEEARRELDASIHPDAMVSAELGWNIDELKDAVFRGLKFARIYLKEVGKKPDLDVPMVLKRPATIKSVCERLHRDFVTKFKFAKVWGKGAKFPGQIFRDIGKELEDGDILELHLR